jgi:hypothetical protein
MVKAADGKVVTDKMIDSWRKALDCDEWPEGWINVGETVGGKPSGKTETKSS